MKKNSNSEARRRALQDRVAMYKIEHGCCMCGVRDPVVLEFHHTNPNSKQFGISTAISRGYTWEKIEVELRKCIVVCANDHARIEHAIRKQ